ncbi:Vps62-related protein [uncultured Enterovirga sp.]|uniref:Vps62-related protein n=1 Tax=uncultured Enterovirga sp. TaxID=2026352 RepID=UPI0035CA95EE
MYDTVAIAIRSDGSMIASREIKRSVLELRSDLQSRLATIAAALLAGLVLGTSSADAACERHIYNNSNTAWTFRADPGRGNVYFYPEGGVSLIGKQCRASACTEQNGPCEIGPACTVKTKWTTSGGTTNGTMHITDGAQVTVTHDWEGHGVFGGSCPDMKYSNEKVVKYNSPEVGDYTIVSERWGENVAPPAGFRPPSVLGLDHRTVTEAFAPRIYLHPNEEWFPSSVSFFEQYATKNGNHYQTKQELSEPSTWDWNGAFGQKPDQASVPVYAFIVDGKKEGNETFTDIVYFTFYPYNRGKEILDTMWGNHVGDWEHVTVRLSQTPENGRWRYTPVKVSFSSHDFNLILPWGSPSLLMTEEGRLVAFSAKGSHGLYPRRGRYVYKEIPVLGKLIDEMDRGSAWDTWKNVVTISKFGGSWRCAGPGGRINPDDCARWLNYPEDFRWGNTQRGCNSVAGQCRLENGPSGPATKDAVSNLNLLD